MTINNIVIPKGLCLESLPISLSNIRRKEMFTNKAFTLIEILVVVLIIGILAAIAVPQYQKAVVKAELHKGIPLVESLYQAQQIYYLTHGDYAINVEDLDISIPLDVSCTKDSRYSRYICDFGTVGIGDDGSNTQYKDPNKIMQYCHFYKDIDKGRIFVEKDSRWCMAMGTSKVAQDVCESLGERQGKYSATNWNWYKLP